MKKAFIVTLLFLSAVVLAQSGSGGVMSGGSASGGLESGGAPVVPGLDSGGLQSGGSVVPVIPDAPSGGVASGGAESGGAPVVTPPGDTASGGAESGGAPVVTPPEPEAPVVVTPEPEPPKPPAGYVWVTRVVDGDTVVADYQGREERIRLIGIDTPEVKGDQPFNKEATAFVTALLQQPIKIIPGEPYSLRDRFERLLAYLQLEDGRDVSLLLAQSGFAKPLTIAPNDRYSALYTSAALGAASVGKGIWAGTQFIDRNCSDFPSQAVAQAFFDGAGPGDRHRLDGNKDGVVCESLSN